MKSPDAGSARSILLLYVDLFDMFYQWLALEVRGPVSIQLHANMLDQVLSTTVILEPHVIIFSVERDAFARNARRAVHQMRVHAALAMFVRFTPERTTEMSPSGWTSGRLDQS